MHTQLPMANSEEQFEEVSHQGKTIKIGDVVMVHHSGERRTVAVRRLVKRNNHYWVGYGDNADALDFCPWPLVKVS